MFRLQGGSKLVKIRRIQQIRRLKRGDEDEWKKKHQHEKGKKLMYYIAHVLK